MGGSWKMKQSKIISFGISQREYLLRISFCLTTLYIRMNFTIHLKTLKIKRVLGMIPSVRKFYSSFGKICVQCI